MKILKFLCFVILLGYAGSLFGSDIFGSQEFLKKIYIETPAPLHFTQTIFISFLWFASALLFAANLSYNEITKNFSGEKFFYSSQIYLCIACGIYECFGSENIIQNSLYIHPLFIICAVAALEFFILIIFSDVMAQVPDAKNWMVRGFCCFILFLIFYSIKVIFEKQSISLLSLSKIGIVLCMFQLSWNLLVVKFINNKNSQPHSLTSRIISHRNQKESQPLP